MAAKQIVRFGLVAAFVAAFVARGAAQQTSPKVSPRDEVKIDVVGIAGWGGTFKVDADGTITFPPIEKPIKVVGLTVREVEKLVSDRLFDDNLLSVHATVKADLNQARDKKVIVWGSVRNPGAVNFAGELSVLDAVMSVGSTTEDAGEIAVITRSSVPTDPADPKKNQEEVNLRLLREGKVMDDVVLHDGDLLFVKKAEQAYLDGYVNRPGAYPVSAGMTLKQIITLAGGIAERGSKSRIEVIRNGKKVDKVNYEKTVVLPGDTITVKSRIL